MDRLTQLRQVGLFGARAPRYTSYPTANHFTPDVGAEDASSWIASISPDSVVSFYLHIPFCRRLCWFCACRTQGTQTLEPVAAYVETLRREIALVKDILPQGVRIGRIHWGGGTPTLLSPDLIRGLASEMSDVAPTTEDFEFSVEIDPNEVDDERLDTLAGLGMNRASIGVQDFDPLIQKAIGRPQGFEVTKAAVDGIRARGVKSLNIDLLYGLPGQTRARLADSVQKVLTLSPDRVAVYGYAHVPWMARRQSMIPAEKLPLPEARLELFETARDLFLWDGYSEIGIDHFARPGDSLETANVSGRLHRNFQGYTDDACPTLIGLGASAISQFREGFAQNAPATSAYQKAIRDGQLATSRGHPFTRDDHMRGAIIERLMCDFAVDFADVASRTGAPRREVEACFEGIEEVFPGVLRRTSEGISLKPDVHEVARLVAGYVDAYTRSESGHSLAI